MIKGIRGATTVEKNDKIEIIKETKVLLNEIIKENEIKTDDIISIIFTMTKDLNDTFPAIAARQMGLDNIPLLDSVEIDVPNSLEKCIRILIHVNTDKSHDDIIHVYLNGAINLRPDLVKKGENDEI